MKEKIKNVCEVDYSENKLTDFLIKTQKIYEVLGYDFKLKSMERSSKNSYNSKVWVNEKYVNSTISNLEIITFNLVYPNLITEIAETNLNNFNEVYSKIIKIYYLNKNESIKKYINMAYGCLQNPDCMIYSKNMYLIPMKLNNLLNIILSEFKDHIVYIDVDQIFFRNFDEIKERFENYFKNKNKYNLSYYSEKSNLGLFIAKKKYVIEKNGIIKIRGMKYFNKNGVCRGGNININK